MAWFNSDWNHVAAVVQIYTPITPKGWRYTKKIIYRDTIACEKGHQNNKHQDSLISLKMFFLKEGRGEKRGILSCSTHERQYSAYKYHNMGNQCMILNWFLFGFHSKAIVLVKLNYLSRYHLLELVKKWQSEWILNCPVFWIFSLPKMMIELYT